MKGSYDAGERGQNPFACTKAFFNNYGMTLVSEKINHSEVLECLLIPLFFIRRAPRLLFVLRLR